MIKLTVYCPNYNYLSHKSTTCDHHREQHKTTLIKLTIQLSGLKVCPQMFTFPNWSWHYCSLSATRQRSLWRSKGNIVHANLRTHRINIHDGAEEINFSSASVCVSHSKGFEYPSQITLPWANLVDQSGAEIAGITHFVAGFFSSMRGGWSVSIGKTVSGKLERKVAEVAAEH